MFHVEHQQGARMKTVIVKRIVVNGEEEVTYNEEGRLESALRKLYETQGDMYYEEFGVCKEDAGKAGWHPADMNFSDTCEGWKKFLSEGGKITKAAVIDTIGVYDLIQDEMTKHEEIRKQQNDGHEEVVR